MRRLLAGTIAAAAAVLTVACAGSASPPAVHHRVATVDYLPGVGADVFLPPAAGTAPLVVLVPGGGWSIADRTGLRPLADRLAGQGIAAVLASYRTKRDGVYFPVPAADVGCAVDFAVTRVREAGVTPTRVILLGHSAGAHLAMLVGLTGQRFRGSCPYPPTRIDGVIGLAGPYDIMSFQPVAQAMFARSAAEDAAVWRDANPVTWVRDRPDLKVLLAHGTADTLVSPTFTTSFADRLRATGHAVQVELVTGASHGSLYRPSVIGARVIAWVRALG